MTALLEASGVSLSFGPRRLLGQVSLDVEAGEVVALVGPNGAGKSTLLGVLAGDTRPDAGEVRLLGRDIRDYTGRELSRHRAVLTQEFALSFPFTVREVVEMGRSPWAGRDTAHEDARIVEAAMASTDVTHLGERHYPSLSGGEKARVSLARVLSQTTDLVLLDEPTAALDLKHQEQVMRIARRLAAEGRGVLIIMHDLTLAAGYADRVGVLTEGALLGPLPPGEMLQPALLTEVYQVEVEVIAHPQTGKPLILPIRRPGDGTGLDWSP